MRYFVYFSYCGTAYHGWQNQPHSVSVQEVMEKAFSLLTGQQIAVTAAGRTDAGVHASLMVAHFDMIIPEGREEQDYVQQLAFRLNGYLPKDIAIHNIVRVRADAHARFDATARTYHYHLTTRKNPFTQGLTTRVFYQLDFDKMNEAAKLLLNTKDFASFQKLHTDVKTTICDVREAYWRQTGESEWVFTITADRFLRNMVRAIVGTLFEVGRGKLTLEQFQDIIDRRHRTAAAESAPADGLYLADVRYPEEIFKM